jgi:hypothetical protein
MTAAVELPEVKGLEPATLAQVIARMGRPDYERWADQVQRTGGCSRPIRLSGRLLRDGVEVYNTANEPDGVLLKRCGTRRASLCPSCAYEYAGDMWQLLYAGAAGGRKGVPETVRDHPLVFTTLTAPSFGPVHTADERKGRARRCRPRRDHPVCGHGRALWCMSTHGPGDPVVGTPLCPDCYDFPGAVLFNWWAPELWRRFTIALRRELAHRLGIAAGDFGDHLRLSYAKVAEFQRRGVVHFHAIVRLDGAGDDYPAPTIELPDRLLEDAIPAAAAHVALRVVGDGENVQLRWGAQVDVQAINGDHAPDGRPVTPETVAAYVAKYATKAAEDFGAGDKPIDASIARSLGVSDHVVRTIETAERLASSVEDLARMRRWTHMLGFRGHFSTKSRRYSTTLGRLRADRAEFRRRSDPNLANARPVGDDDQDDEDTTLIVGEWKFVGVGHTSNGDAVLAAAAAARAREWRELAREQMN